MAPAPRRELEEKKSSYTLGSPTTGAGGRSARTEEELQSLEGEHTIGLQQLKRKKTCTNSQCYCPALPSPK